jgi:hypothetical protein
MKYFKVSTLFYITVLLALKNWMFLNPFLGIPNDYSTLKSLILHFDRNVLNLLYVIHFDRNAVSTQLAMSFDRNVLLLFNL